VTQAELERQVRLVIDGGARGWTHEFVRTLKQTERGAESRPFPQYDYFDPLWDAYEARANAVIRKTRQVTATWFGAATRLYNALWRRDWMSFVLSRKEALVDDGGENATTKSLFGKIKFIYDQLPAWQRRGNPLEFNHLRIWNPRTQSAVLGGSSSPREAAAGSYQDLWWDEAAHGTRTEAAFAAARPTAPYGFWLVSTPMGRRGAFPRVYLGQNDWRKIDIPWWSHPERRCSCTDPLDLDPSKHRGCWYARACEDMTPAQIASELNMSFSESVAGRVFWPFHADIHVGEVPYIERLPVYRAWDFGVAMTAVTLFQPVTMHTVNGRLVKGMRVFDSYAATEKPAVHYREVLEERASRYVHSRVIDIGDDWSLNARLPDKDLSTWRILLSNGDHPYKIQVQKSGAAGNELGTLIDNANKFFRSVEARVGDEIQLVPRIQIDAEAGHNRFWIEMFENWSRPTDEEGRVTSETPAHDVYSHPGTSFYYGAWWYSPIEDSIETPIAMTEADVVTAGRVFSPERAGRGFDMEDWL